MPLENLDREITATKPVALCAKAADIAGTESAAETKSRMNFSTTSQPQQQEGKAFLDFKLT
jgi:hypothetical protein